MTGYYAMRTACPGCACEACRSILDFGQQAYTLAPLQRSMTPAVSSRVQLQVCEDCGLIFIREPMRQSCLLPVRNPHARMFPPDYPQLLARLVRDGGSVFDRVWDIYCDDGGVLRELRAGGMQALMGIEPTAGSSVLCRESGFYVETGIFSLELAQEMVAKHGWPDRVLLRNALEHAERLADYLRGLAFLLSKGASAILQLPNFARTMREGMYHDLNAAHCNHFTPDTLCRLLRAHGLSAKATGQDEHGGGNLFYEIRTGTGGALSSPDPEAVDRFVWRCRDNLEAVRAEVQNVGRRYGRIAACGFSVPGHALLGYSSTASSVCFVIEERPVWRGRVLPGCELPVIDSRTLHDHPPEVCLLLPQWNREEQMRLRGRCAEWLRRDGLVVEFCPPEQPGVILSERLVRECV